MARKQDIKELLKEKGLRATAPRMAVLMQLAAADAPLSHSEVLDIMGDGAECDPATVYRNLVRLTEAGITKIVSRAEGMSRYALAMQDAGADDHAHPHFVCDDCGQVSCLSVEFSMTSSPEDRWKASVGAASLQLRGECPDCIVKRE